MTKLTEKEIEMAREISLTTLLGIKSGRRDVSMRCPLPNHRDSIPSFHVYDDNSFHCFGCDRRGNNAVDFVILLGYSFVDAVVYLLKDYAN